MCIRSSEKKLDIVILIYIIKIYKKDPNKKKD